MNLEKKKYYVEGFVSRGLPIEEAYKLAYSTAEDIEAMDKDVEFQERLSDLALTITDRYLEDYNRTVESKGFAGDHLTRLRTFRKNVFNPDDGDKLPDLNINIVKSYPDEHNSAGCTED